MGYTIGQGNAGLPWANGQPGVITNAVPVVRSLGFPPISYYGHHLGKREAESDPYTIGQVNHGLTNGGVITGVDYGHGVVSGVGAIGSRAGVVAAGVVSPAGHHVVPTVHSNVVPTVHSGVVSSVVPSVHSTGVVSP